MAHRTSLLLFVLATTACVQAASEPVERLAAAFSHLSVPEVRGVKDSRQIEVAYLHLKGEANGFPTFVFFGGPGESALDYETLDNLEAAHKDLLTYGDVVFVEQRGIGASRPRLDCGAIRFARNKPLTPEALLRQHASALESCAVEFGADMAGYTVNAIADDADEIRELLGMERINVVGGSFGARQAYVYLRRRSDRVNRAVLTQFLAPSTALAYPSTIDDYIAQIGERVGPLHGLDVRGGQALQELVREVFEQVETSPVTVQVGNESIVIGRTDLEIITALALRRTRDSGMLPLIFNQMKGGDYSLIGGYIYQFFRNQFPVNAAVLSFDCVEQIASNRRTRFEQEVSHTISGPGAHLPFPGVCDEFDFDVISDGVDADQYDLRGIPTLLIQGELDARARDENLKDILDTNDNVQLLVIGNATHDLGRSVSNTIGSRTEQITADFLSHGHWPEVDRIDVSLGSNKQGYVCLWNDSFVRWLHPS